eukprot:gene30134-37298_t
MYDGDNQVVDCSVSTLDPVNICPITFTFDKDVDGPINVYYEMDKFYQNHRKYVSSMDFYQLGGTSVSKTDLEASCISKVTVTQNGVQQIMNPCGLVAASYFTDTFALTSSPGNAYTMDESDISWSSDDDIFKQPSGFESCEDEGDAAVCPGELKCNALSTCQSYTDPSTSIAYYFAYPNDATVQYLYEMYPNKISPINGVTDEHFKVWMRTAVWPKFRKLYGVIDGNFKKGQSLTFQVNATYEVSSYGASKSLLLSTQGQFGGANPFIGVSYIVVGTICLWFAFLFLGKQLVMPREISSPASLGWEDSQ